LRKVKQSKRDDLMGAQSESLAGAVSSGPAKWVKSALSHVAGVPTPVRSKKRCR
jgi:hypothetical protein